MEKLPENNFEFMNEQATMDGQSTMDNSICPIVRFIQEFGIDDDSDALAKLISMHFKMLLNTAIKCARPEILEYIIDFIKRCDLDVKFSPGDDYEDNLVWAWILKNVEAGHIDGIKGLPLFYQVTYGIYPSDEPEHYEKIKDIIIREFMNIDFSDSNN